MGVVRGCLLSLCLVVACSHGTYSSLVALQAEPTGANCPAGGVKLTSGGDLNGDGMLGADEVAPPPAHGTSLVSPTGRR
jgi:hypothetical protein